MRLRQLLCGFTLLVLVGAQAGELRAQFGGFGALFGLGQSDNQSQSHQRQQAASRRGTQPSPSNPIHADRLPDMDELQARIQRVLDDYYTRPLNTRDHDSWEVMHTIIAYGVKAEVAVGGPQGERRNAIGWLCYNLPLRGPRMLTVRNDRPYAVKGVSVQGHHGQFLAILAQSRLMRNYPLMIDGKKFTIEDLIEAEKRTCVAGDELTFKLIALAHYLPSDAQWQCDKGQTWSIPRLIREEIRQPITHSAACGGTHRLMGLSYAVRRREQQRKPIDGEFALAKQYLQRYFDWTFTLQNSDGSFSTAWLARRENRPDIDRKIQCTGHITEWLVYALPKHELHNPQVVAAVNFLTTSLERGRNRDWKIGPLGHALHALAIYKARVFEGKEDQPPEPEATTDAVAQTDAAATRATTGRDPSANDTAASDTKAGAIPGRDAKSSDAKSSDSGTVATEPADKVVASDGLDEPAIAVNQAEAAVSRPVLSQADPLDETMPEYEPLTPQRVEPVQDDLPRTRPGQADGERLRIRMEAGPDWSEESPSPDARDEFDEPSAAPAIVPPMAPEAQADQDLESELFQLIYPDSEPGIVQSERTTAPPDSPQPASTSDSLHLEAAGQAAGGAAILLKIRDERGQFSRQLPAQRERPSVHIGRRVESAEGPALIGPR